MMGLLGKNSTDEVLRELIIEVKALRDDVQRAGVISGLLSRPGGMSMDDVVSAADRFAKEMEN